MSRTAMVKPLNALFLKVPVVKANVSIALESTIVSPLHRKFHETSKSFQILYNFLDEKTLQQHEFSVVADYNLKPFRGFLAFPHGGYIQNNKMKLMFPYYS